MSRILTIATRRGALAVAQTQIVAAALMDGIPALK